MGIKHYHDNLKELNELNTDIYINKKKEKYQKYFIPDKEGEYDIILKFDINITNCSYMFAGCKNITNIEFISFNTKYVTNMKYMFYECRNLKNLSIDDISNVINEELDNFIIHLKSCNNNISNGEEIIKKNKQAMKKINEIFGFLNVPNNNKINIQNYLNDLKKLITVKEIEKKEIIKSIL
jgi:surface protein